uniref:Secreted protein n=1 Tax=Glossina palpalis gambiensis TaxID=67801 RepID=A0A1B0B4Q6_9MUSC
MMMMMMMMMMVTTTGLLIFQLCTMTTVVTAAEYWTQQQQPNRLHSKLNRNCLYKYKTLFNNNNDNNNNNNNNNNKIHRWYQTAVTSGLLSQQAKWSMECYLFRIERSLRIAAAVTA